MVLADSGNHYHDTTDDDDQLRGLVTSCWTTCDQFDAFNLLFDKCSA